MKPALRYLLVWLVFSLILLSAVASLNLLIDPYSLFRVVDVEGLNHVKSRASQRGETFKRSAAERMHPNGLILGNSQAEIGFDPHSPAWLTEARPIFNLALPGRGIQSALKVFSDLLKHARPGLVVVGLEFLDFRADSSAEYAAQAAEPAEAVRRLREQISLLTVDVLADSLATLMAQRNPYSASLTETGFNPMRDYLAIARNEGYHAMFMQRNRENASAFVRGPKSIYLPDGKLPEYFAGVRAMVKIASERSIPLRLVIYPYHSHTLVLFHQTRLWPAFEAWKTELVKILELAPVGSDIEL